MPEIADVTALLQGMAASSGADVAALFPVVYDELRKLAERHLAKERIGHTLQPTALAHEAYLKLVKQKAISWQNRLHFYAAAGQAIRRILVDHARGRKRQKRAARRIPLLPDSLEATGDQNVGDLTALDEALHKLQELAPRKARVVELRFFSGLSTEQAAALLGITTRTVERDWQYSRAWLFRELNPAYAGH